jgi:hypothetical protein
LIEYNVPGRQRKNALSARAVRLLLGRPEALAPL